MGIAIAFVVSRTGRQQTLRLAIAQTLPGEEEQQFVLAMKDFGNQHRAAEGEAILIVVKNRRLSPCPAIEVEVGVEVRNLVELIHAAMERIGSALGDLIDDAADGVTERCVRIKGTDGDFVDGILGRAERLRSEYGEVGRAVEQYFAVLLGRAAETPRIRSVTVKRVRDTRGRGCNNAD